MVDLSVFDRVVAGEITPDAGAIELLERRQRRFARPAWMPRLVYAVVAFVVFALTAAFTSRNG